MLDTQKLEYQISRNLLDGKSLAAKTGVSETSIGRLRRGDTQPRAATMRKLCEALNCKPEDLLKEVG